MTVANVPKKPERRARENPLSVFRIGVIAGIAGIVITILGFLLFIFVDRGTRQQPLEIAIYPGAQQWGAPIPISRTSRAVVYRIPGTTDEDVQQVINYYNERLREHYGTGADLERFERECLREPLAGNFPAYDQGVPNTPPYRFTCFFDRSYGDATQWTRITIQPGIPSDDENTNSQGYVVIRFDYQWTP